MHCIGSGSVPPKIKLLHVHVHTIHCTCAWTCCLCVHVLHTQFTRLTLTHCPEIVNKTLSGCCQFCLVPIDPSTTVVQLHELIKGNRVLSFVPQFDYIALNCRKPRWLLHAKDLYVVLNTRGRGVKTRITG